MIDNTAATFTSPRRGWLLIVASILFTAAIAFICLNRTFPLGVPGEWVWNRLPRSPLFSVVPVVVAAGVFIVLCCVGRKWIERSHRRTPFAMLLAMLAAIPLHWSLFFMPDSPMGPERWILSLSHPSSSGYLIVAIDSETSVPLGEQIAWTTVDFLRGYEAWIAKQDSFHIGTHPPGLFLVYRWTYRGLSENTWVTAAIWRSSPSRVTDAVTLLHRWWKSYPALGLSVIIAVSLLTWLACWLSCPIVYALARQVSSPAASYSSATLWLLAPGPLLFMPLADVGYVLVSSTLAALLIAGPRYHPHPIFPMLFGILAGVIFIVGINLSLAFTVPLFFAVLAGVFLEPRSFFLLRWWLTWAAFLLTVGAIVLWFRFGLGFNLPAILWINLQKHRGFYEAFPRSYWLWVGVNLIEFAATVGVLSVALVAAAFTAPRRNRIALAFLATLIILDLIGKNLSEAGRLWLFLTPLAAAAAAPVFEPEKLPVRRYFLLLFLEAICAVFLYSSVEPLLPIAPPL